VSPASTTTYTITNLTDNNCTAQAGDMTGGATVTVNPAATVDAGPDQYNTCIWFPTITLAGSYAGAASSATWTTTRQRHLHE